MTRDLSRREAEILELIANGARTADVLDATMISPHTLRTHISTILRKTHTATRAAAVAWAWRNGTIQGDGEGRRVVLR